MGKKPDKGLAKSLIRDRFKGQRHHNSGNGEAALVHTSDLNDGYDWGRTTESVTEQGNLDEFLATAELAGTEFTAERLDVKIITNTSLDPQMSAEQLRRVTEAQDMHRHMLQIPRRPPWTKEMSGEELQTRERESFLEWRRHLAGLQEVEHIVMTPFERNLEFWRQLWRVLERSHVVVQIVDARNPLLFRCDDLEQYVHELDPTKKNLLLVNKADLLTDEQREIWAEYFNREGIPFCFFSAKLETSKQAEEAAQQEELLYPDEYGAKATLHRTFDPFESNHQPTSLLSQLTVDDGDANDEDDNDEETEEATGATGTSVAEGDDDEAGLDDDDDDEEEGGDATEDETVVEASNEAAGADPEASDPTTASDWVGSTRLLSCEDLLAVFTDLLKGIESEFGDPVVGMVGYPNVGKSSTINALKREKRVPVSSTPGRTKHFQTVLMGGFTLCDCPGLVFPTFVNTKTELVCNGILPIDQLRDCVPPVGYVCRCIPRSVLEETYGIAIIKPAEDEDPNRAPSAMELLRAYSFARGYFAGGSGLPDTSRGARYILKDFVQGRLLSCAAPPGLEDRFPNARAVEGFDETVVSPRDIDTAVTAGPRHAPSYVNEVDESFFKQEHVRVITKGTQARVERKEHATSKKHHKKNQKEKARRVKPSYAY